jgi:sugar transferase EpsL
MPDIFSTLLYSTAKRALDILLAATAGLVALPMIALLVVILRFTQRSVFFHQTRPGLNARPFVLYKFCSMRNTRDERGQLLPDDQRLTRIGAIIRGLSLDELPQLWNVLRGDMSMVGPRPLLMSYLSRYTPEQARRHSVKPGITGWAQIHGRNSLDWEQKFALDLWYVDHRSMLLDLKILLLTFAQVMARRGISYKQSATMPEFLGKPDVNNAAIPRDTDTPKADII